MRTTRLVIRDLESLIVPSMRIIKIIFGGSILFFLRMNENALMYSVTPVSYCLPVQALDGSKPKSLIESNRFFIE